MDENELLTIGEAALQLGVTPAGVRAIERRGHITSIRTVGNHRRYRLGDVVRLGERKRLKTNRHQRIPPPEEVERRKPRSRRHGGRDILTEEAAYRKPPPPGGCLDGGGCTEWDPVQPQAYHAPLRTCPDEDVAEASPFAEGQAMAPEQGRKHTEGAHG